MQLTLTQTYSHHVTDELESVPRDCRFKTKQGNLKR